MTHQICIPWSPCGGKFKTGLELRYALRSLEKHFQDDYEVTIISPKKPDWYHGKWVKQTEGKLKSALKLAAKEYPKGFFWWYDDCVLIKDQTGDDMRITPCRQSWGKILTSWGRKLEQIRERLAKEGFKPWDYSKPHGPYWFDGSMIDESFQDWKGMSGKFPFESWILSKRDWPRRFGVEAQYYGAFRNPPAGDKVIVNWCDRGFTPELIAWLDGQFPEPCEEEKAPTEVVEVVPPSEPKRVLFTCHEGCDPRVWQWCGEGIKVFAESHKAELIELPKCLDANPQWVLFDAFKASLAYSEIDEFAWVDSDLVIAYPATDVWGVYPKKLHVCVKSGHYRDNLAARVGLPKGYPNNCTGVVKWNRAEAEKLSTWYEANKHRFPKTDGDQELLGAACHELGIPFSWFHRKMHVAGGNPPPITVFKHKGGKSKIRWIPRFLETNRQLGRVRKAATTEEPPTTEIFPNLRYVYINMTKDSERNESFLREFPGVDWWRFPGCEGGLMWGEIARGLGLLGNLRVAGRKRLSAPKWGTFGCSLSHILCLKMATIADGIVLFPDDVENTLKLDIKELVAQALLHRPKGVGWIKLKNQKPLYDTGADAVHHSGGHVFKRLAKGDRGVRFANNTGSAAVIILREQAKAILAALPPLTSTHFDNELQGIFDKVPGGCWQMLNTGIHHDNHKLSVREQIDKI